MYNEILQPLVDLVVNTVGIDSYANAIATGYLYLGDDTKEWNCVHLYSAWYALCRSQSYPAIMVYRHEYGEGGGHNAWHVTVATDPLPPDKAAWMSIHYNLAKDSQLPHYYQYFSAQEGEESMGDLGAFIRTMELVDATLLALYPYYEGDIGPKFWHVDGHRWSPSTDG